METVAPIIRKTAAPSSGRLATPRHPRTPSSGNLHNIFTFDTADVASLTKMDTASSGARNSLIDQAGDASSFVPPPEIHPSGFMMNHHQIAATTAGVAAATVPLAPVMDSLDVSGSSEPAATGKPMNTMVEPSLNPDAAAALMLDHKYPVDVQQWRDTGFGAFRYQDSLYPGGGGTTAGGFWRPAYGGYPVSGPSSGLSRESSRDDLTSMMEGQIFEYEERFRVDRRKLELMMMGRFDPVKEPALDFFQRIGEETSTTIIWPSRLKIGAKSKKDPNIRIGGTEECVKRAKSQIMEYLDTKTTRVTMKMDVSYTDHSHVIGKGGNTIRRVMAETGCHVHFPDSNRSNPNEKSNQVSIAGEMEGVEKARARVRELAPLVFTFDLPIVPSIEHGPTTHDLNDPYLKAVQDQYNIQIMFRQKQKNFPTTVVVVKGCEWEAARVKEATLVLVDHLYGRYAAAASAAGSSNNGGSPSSGGALVVGGGGGSSSGDTPPNSAGLATPTGGSSISSGSSGGGGNFAHSVPISMNLEISPIHHGVVLGKGNMTLRSIMQRTKTTILFPDASDPNIPPIRKGSVVISGAIHNVYFARQQLLGSLPIVMMFEMPDSSMEGGGGGPGSILDESNIVKLQEELDVCISIKPKTRQHHHHHHHMGGGGGGGIGSKSVLIKAQERNASAMYKARQILLGLEVGAAVEATIPETYKMQQVANNPDASFFQLNNSASSNNNDPMFRLHNESKIYNSSGGGNPSGASLNPLIPQPFLAAAAADPRAAFLHYQQHLHSSQMSVEAAAAAATAAAAAAAATAASNNNVSGQPPEAANPLMALLNQKHPHPPPLNGAPAHLSAALGPAAGKLHPPGMGGVGGGGAGGFVLPPNFPPFPPTAAAAAAAADLRHHLNQQQLLMHHTKWAAAAAAAAAGGGGGGVGAGFNAHHQAAAANQLMHLHAAAGAHPLQQPPIFPNNLPPNHPYLKDYARLVLQNITRMQQEELNSTAASSNNGMPAAAPKPKEDPNNNYIQGSDVVKPAAMVSAVQSPPSPDDNPVFTHHGSGRVVKQVDGISPPRNSSPVHDLGNVTNQLEDLDLDSSRDTTKKYDRGCSTSSAVSGLNSSELTNNNNSSSSRNGAATGNGSRGGSCSSSADNNNDSSCDWRAPGWEKQQQQQQAVTGNNSFQQLPPPQQQQLMGDYDAKRLLAAKALQTKPCASEQRTPTTTWSGLGFSSSMPENVIREQLGSDSSDNSCNSASAAAVIDNDKHPMASAAAHAAAAAAAAAANAHAMQPQQQQQQPPQPPVAAAAAAHVAAAAAAANNGNWFGNSSALDSLLNNPKTLANDPAHFDDDLPSLFAKQGLAKYTDLFLRHEVDIQTFASLTEQDLKEIGIQTFGARKKLLLLANKVKQMLSVHDSIRNHHW